MPTNKTTAKRTTKAAPRKRTAKPEAEAVKPEAKADVTERRNARVLRDTTATVEAGRYPFGKLTARDAAYLAMLHELGGGKPVATSAIVALSRNPFYSGSAKAYDAGAFIRLAKAGFIDVTDGNVSFRTAEAAAVAKSEHRKHS